HRACERAGGRGAAWTEERGTSDEGRRCLKGARRRANHEDGERAGGRGAAGTEEPERAGGRGAAGAGTRGRRLGAPGTARRDHGPLARGAVPRVPAVRGATA